MLHSPVAMSRLDHRSEVGATGAKSSVRWAWQASRLTFCSVQVAPPTRRLWDLPLVAVRDDAGNRLGCGQVGASLRRVSGPVATGPRPVVAQIIQQAGGNLQLSPQPTGGNEQLATAGWYKHRCPVAIVSGNKLPLLLLGDGNSERLLCGRHLAAIPANSQTGKVHGSRQKI